MKVIQWWIRWTFLYCLILSTDSIHALVSSPNTSSTNLYFSLSLPRTNISTHARPTNNSYFTATLFIIDILWNEAWKLGVIAIPEPSFLCESLYLSSLHDPSLFKINTQNNEFQCDFLKSYLKLPSFMVGRTYCVCTAYMWKQWATWRSWFSPCIMWVLNSGHQACWQVPLLTESSFWSQ